MKTPVLKANGEGGDKRVTRDSLNNMPFAPFKHLWGVNSTVILVRHDQKSNFSHNKWADSSCFALYQAQVLRRFSLHQAHGLSVKEIYILDQSGP